MKKLSTGHDSTLITWRRIVTEAFGADSPAIEFLDGMIEKQGEDAEVLADEAQFITLLSREHLKKYESELEEGKSAL